LGVGGYAYFYLPPHLNLPFAMKDKHNYKVRIGNESGTNAHAKTKWCNGVRCAMKHVFKYARENKISLNRLKQKVLLKMYAESIGEAEVLSNFKEPKQWLYNYYIDNLRRPERELFYWSKPWRNLRIQVLNRYGYVCMKCGSQELLHVDHIKPRSLYPELELCFNNMQVLCQKCNIGKSNRNQIDYRKSSTHENKNKDSLLL
jgi:5-methylcytosine-specific restriction endonuclease McrA